MEFLSDLLDQYCYQNYGHKNWKQDFNEKGEEIIIFLKKPAARKIIKKGLDK